MQGDLIMGNSLADQLLKSGLANKKQAQKAGAEKRRKQKQQRHQKNDSIDENQLALKKAQTEKVERDRELNRKKKAEADKKALAAQIKQLITQNRIAPEEGETAFNFTDENRVKTRHLSEKQVNALRTGKIAIARLDTDYEMIPAAAAQKINERAPERIVYQATASEDDTSDSEYADFEVPDDLDW